MFAIAAGGDRGAGARLNGLGSREREGVNNSAGDAPASFSATGSNGAPPIFRAARRGNENGDSGGGGSAVSGGIGGSDGANAAAKVHTQPSGQAD